MAVSPLACPVEGRVIVENTCKHAAVSWDSLNVLGSDLCVFAFTH